MNTTLFLLLLAIVSIAPNQAKEHVDLVELNCFHDCNARHVYDQVIFYEWDPGLSRYHVRAWVLSDNDKQPQCDYRSGLYVVRYTDRDAKIERIITATHYRRSWSQIDPERDNKKLLDERDRNRLIKRSVASPTEPIPEDNPMMIDFVGGME